MGFGGQRRVWGLGMVFYRKITVSVMWEVEVGLWGRSGVFYGKIQLV